MVSVPDDDTGAHSPSQRLKPEPLAAASTLVTEERFRSAVARAYSAAFSKVAHELVVTAGLEMPPGREGPSHSRLRPLIETSVPHMAQNRREKLSGIYADSSRSA